MVDGEKKNREDNLCIYMAPHCCVDYDLIS